MFSVRTKLSLGQFLELQEPHILCILLQKHGLVFPSEYDALIFSRGGFEGAANEQLRGLIDEIVRTRGDLRNQVNPRYRFDERWDDIRHCLELDGYRLDNGGLVPIEPILEGTVPIEDDLTREIRASGLAETEEIIRLLASSGDAFSRVPPDYNGCLTNARVALETLGKGIARIRCERHRGNFDDRIWGQVLAFLRVSGLVTEEEERGIAGVYGFVSPGAHRPLGLSEEETARLGRSLAVSMCYFLIKRHNGGAKLQRKSA
jgi:hypothetical protein